MTNPGDIVLLCLTNNAVIIGERLSEDPSAIYILKPRQIVRQQLQNGALGPLGIADENWLFSECVRVLLTNVIGIAYGVRIDKNLTKAWIQSTTSIVLPELVNVGLKIAN